MGVFVVEQTFLECHLVSERQPSQIPMKLGLWHKLRDIGVR
jgi:hypothetical protein